MASLAVVEDLDPLEDQITRVRAVPLRLVEIEFHLEGGKEALHRGVVPAFPLSTHALERLQALQGLSILTTGVLNPLVRVMENSLSRTTGLLGHRECGHDQLGMERPAHGPPDDLPGEEVHDHRQVHPPFRHREVRDVRDPFLVGPVCSEVAVEEILGHWMPVSGVRRRSEFPLAAHPEPCRLHQSGDPRSTDLPPVVRQYSLDTGGTIGAPALLVNLVDRRREGHVRLDVAVFWPSPPRKIATHANVERPAQQLDRVFMTMLLNKLIDQFSLAKKATAFFRISRS